MIKLNIIPVHKEIKVHNKKVKIPKLGLKHYKLLKDVKGVDENMKLLLKSIHPNLTASEAELVIVHLLAFNNRIKEKQMFGDFELDINNTYICSKTKFKIGETEYIFKEPKLTDKFSGPLDVLQKQFVKSVPAKEISFIDMPAYVLNWAEDIQRTVAIDTPVGTIYGAINIVGKIDESDI